MTELPTSLIDVTSYVLIEHTRMDIARCHCGWGSYAGNLGESHARHVAKALLEAGVLRGDKPTLRAGDPVTVVVRGDHAPTGTVKYLGNQTGPLVVVMDEAEGGGQ